MDYAKDLENELLKIGIKTDDEVYIHIKELLSWANGNVERMKYLISKMRLQIDKEYNNG